MVTLESFVGVLFAAFCGSIIFGKIARIQSIAHSSIGVIREVKTDGLDYLFFPETGEPISVNAEEAPGYTDGDFVEVSDWTLQVSLSEISEPVDPT